MSVYRLVLAILLTVAPAAPGFFSISLAERSEQHEEHDDAEETVFGTASRALLVQAPPRPSSLSARRRRRRRRLPQRLRRRRPSLNAAPRRHLSRRVHYDSDGTGDDPDPDVG